MGLTFQKRICIKCEQEYIPTGGRQKRCISCSLVPESHRLWIQRGRVPRRPYINKGQTCKFPECERPADKLGLCNAHYGQQYRKESLRPIQVGSGGYKNLGKKRYQADYALLRKYGFGVEELEKRVAAQDNTCLISFLPFTKTPSVDHIGTLGQPDFVVRGLLTRQANLMLGYIEGLGRLGADLKTITAPHVYDYIMRGRAQQQRQLEQSRGATA